MTLVVKVGGELALPEREAELHALARDLAGAVGRGERVLVVHGGGPQTTALMRARGIEPRIVDGRRVTDEAALAALIMAVRGEVNLHLTSVLQAAGVDAVGLDGVSARCIFCVRQPPRPISSAKSALVDYGLVGDVERVDRRFFELFLDRGMVPVIACIGSDERGRPLNVNADALAGALASSMSAKRLLLITGVPGVLREMEDPGSRFVRLSAAEAREAIAVGAIAGGMIAKVEEAFSALAAGVPEVHILGRLGPGDLERALLEPGSMGTTLHAEGTNA